MSFGYLGDTSTKIKQRVKNDGVLSIDDVRELEVNKQIGGSYQLVQTFDFGGAAFLDIDVSVLGGYDVVFWIGEGITLNSDDAFSVRVSKTGDSNIDSGATNYEFGMNSTTLQVLYQRVVQQVRITFSCQQILTLQLMTI